MITQLNELIQYPNRAREGFEEGRHVLQSIADAFENIDNSENESNAVSIKTQIINQIPNLGPGGQNPFSKPLPLSAGSIRVIPDGLREAAHEAQDIIEMSNEISSRISKVISDLQSSWEGRAYDRFSDEFIQIKEIYIHLSDALEEFSQKVIAAANRYEEIDNLLN